MKQDKREYFTHTQPDGTLKLYLTNPAVCDCGTIHYSGPVVIDEVKHFGIHCESCNSDLLVKKVVINYPVIDYREFK